MTTECKYQNVLGYYSHHWMVATPNPEKYGSVSPGKCRCGATKDFSNSDNSSIYASNVHLFRHHPDDRTTGLNEF